jgi:hypothetical protein
VNVQLDKSVEDVETLAARLIVALPIEAENNPYELVAGRSTCLPYISQACAINSRCA